MLREHFSVSHLGNHNGDGIKVNKLNFTLKDKLCHQRWSTLNYLNSILETSMESTLPNDGSCVKIAGQSPVT